MRVDPKDDKRAVQMAASKAALMADCWGETRVDPKDDKRAVQRAE